MTRSCFLAIVAVVTTTFPGLAQPSPDHAVVFIQAGAINPINQARLPSPPGTGFLIDLQGHIITSKHVILHRETEVREPRPWVTVSLRHRHASPVQAQILLCEPGDIDLCLIKISSASVSAAGINSAFTPSCRHLRGAERIEAIGYPLGNENPVLRIPGSITGELAALLKYPSNVQIVPGMSGGPVLDESGKVVAANYGGVEGLPTFTFLQPLLHGDGLFRRAAVTCAAPPPQARSKQDGEPCSFASNRSNECNSGYCLPAPHLQPGGSGKHFCIARSQHCALSGSNGAGYGSSQSFDGQVLWCCNPQKDGHVGAWAQFYRLTKRQACAASG